MGRNVESCPGRGGLSKWARGALTAALVCALTAAAEAGPIPDNPRYTFTPVGDELGLSSSIPMSMIIDSRGFIWVASVNDVYRFAGFEGTRFDTPFGLAALTLLESPDGTIWVTGDSGIARFNGSEFVRFESREHDSELTNIDLWIMQRFGFTSTNTMYVAVQTGLLALDLAGDDEPRLWPAEEVQAVYVDEQDHVWFAAGGKAGVLRHATGELELTELPAEVAGERAVAFITDESGTVWLRTSDHLLARRPESKRFEVDESLVVSAMLWGLPSRDARGELLIPSTDGLYYRDKDRWKRVSKDNGLLGNSVSCAIEDREGGLWIGGSGFGIQRWAGRGEWVAWTEAEGLPDNFLSETYRDPGGRLWVATQGGLAIWLPDERLWKTLSAEDGLNSDMLSLVKLGPEGWVWVISANGLKRIDPETFAVEDIDIPNVPRTGVSYITSAPDGTLWGVSERGVFTARVEDGELLFNLDREKRTTWSSFISITEGGVVWTTGDGLARYDGRSWEYYNERSGVKIGRTLLLSAMSDREAWVSVTSGGVIRFMLTEAGPRITRYGTDQGLLDDVVYELSRDPKGTLWIGHANGISLLRPDGTVDVLDRWDGLIYEDISSDGIRFEPDGGVFISTSGGGLAYYKPSREKKKSPPPEAVILEAALGGEDVLGQDRPRVKQEDGSFNVRFAGLTYGNPRRIGFKYRMVGLDDEEVETKDRAVRYAALPPGDYRFEVWCKSAAGVWSAAPATFAFVVEGVLWQDFRAWVGAAAVVVVLLFALVLVRTRRRALP